MSDFSSLFNEQDEGTKSPNDFSSLFNGEESEANAAHAVEATPQLEVDPKTEVPPTSPNFPQRTDHPMDLGEAFVDTGRAIGRGAEDAVRGTYQAARGVMNMAPGVNIPDYFEGKPHVFEEPHALANRIAKDVVQFGLGLVGGQKMLQATGAAAKAPEAVKAVMASGLGTGIVADANSPRLSNLIEEYPILANPITHYLSAKPDDSVAEGKFKASLEDMLTNPVAMTLFHGVKIVKDAIVNKAVNSSSVDELESSLKGANEAQESTTPPEKFPENVVPEETQVKPGESKEQILKNGEQSEMFPEMDKKETGEPESSVFHMTPVQKSEYSSTVDSLIRAGEVNIPPPPSNMINWKNVETHNEVKQGLESLATILKPAIDANAGSKQAFKQIENSAYTLGTNPEKLMTNLSSWGTQVKDIVPTMMAGRLMAVSLAEDIHRLGRSIYMGVGGDTARLEYLRKKEVLATVLGFTKSMQTATARATASNRIKVSGKFTPNQIMDLINSSGGKQSIDEEAKRLALAETPEQALKMLNPSTASSVIKKVLETHNMVWVNGILSGVKTHVINNISTAMNTVMNPVNLMVGGALRRDYEAVREGMALYSGMRKSLFDSLDFSRRAFQSERSILDVGQGSLDNDYSAVGSSKYYNLDPEHWMGTAVDFLGKVARIPSRFLTAEDELWKQLNYRGHVMAHVTREASDLIKTGKLDPKAMTINPVDGGNIPEYQHYIQQRFNSYFTPEGSGTNAAALDWARRATFTQDLKADTWIGNKSLAESIQTVARNHPILRGTILPFVRVPANLMRNAVDSNLITAPLRKQFWSDLNAGGERANMAIGRMAVGSAFATAAGILAWEGRITGGMPGDKDLANAVKDTGAQPYSFVLNIGGKNQYVSFQRLDPFGMPFGILADFHQIANSVDEKVRDSLATSITLALAKNLSSKSYLKGLVEWSSMLGAGYSEDEKIARLLQMRAASYVPSIMGVVQPDDELKQVRSMLDAIMAKIPGMSSLVEAKRDYFGEKKLAPMGYPWNAINPFSVGEDNGDPVKKEMARLALSPAQSRFVMPETTIGNVDLTKLKNSKGQTAYDRWTELLGSTKLGGKTLHESLNDLINSPRYQNGSDGTSAYHSGNRPLMIQTEAERYRTEAQRHMIREFSDEAPKLGYDLKELLHLDQQNRSKVRVGKSPNTVPLDALKEMQ